MPSFDARGGTIEAFAWTGQDSATWPEWLLRYAYSAKQTVCSATMKACLHLAAPQGPIMARRGDYLVPHDLDRIRPTSAIFVIPKEFFEDMFRRSEDLPD